MDFGWARRFEAFAVCRNCSRSTTFVIFESPNHDIGMFEETSPLKLSDALNNYFDVRSFISLKDQGEAAPVGHAEGRLLAYLPRPGKLPLRIAGRRVAHVFAQGLD